MKNIFKFMGIALIASSMVLVGCQKDNTNDTNTNNNTNQQEETYKLTLKVNDNAMGTVTANPQKESYKKGDTVVLTATANDGYTFANWNDGNSDNPRTVTVTENKTYTANFVVATPNHTTITFGENTWEATVLGGYVSSQDKDWMQLYIYENIQDPTKAHVMIQGPKVAGNYSMSDENNWLAFYYTNDGDTMTYNNDTSTPVWQPMNFSMNITKIELNNLFIEFTAEAMFANFLEYQTDHQNYTKKSFSADVKNTWMSMNKK